MEVVGFTIVRNAVRYDYPVVESIQSLLPIVSKMVVAVGNCDDGTRELIQNIDSDKLQIIDTVWDESKRQGGTILAEQTNLALGHCEGDWAAYLQADEVLHENDLDRIESAMRRNQNKTYLDGLSFRYHHFRADYSIRDPLPYRHQVRVIRPNGAVQSYGDACGFRVNGRKLRTAPTRAWVYHYGYVKPPENMAAKFDYFASLYDGRQVIPGEENIGEFIWDLRTCEPFSGSHPAVMHDRIAHRDWAVPENLHLVPRWRNPSFYGGLLQKNTRTIRRWTSKAQGLLKKSA